MALHWKHIKGINGTSSAAALYTFLEFKTGAVDNNNLQSFSPDLVVNNENNSNTPSQYNLGHIVTNGITHTFLASQYFAPETALHFLTDADSSSKEGYIYGHKDGNNNYFIIYGAADTPVVLYSAATTQIRDDAFTLLAEFKTNQSTFKDTQASVTTNVTANNATVVFEGVTYFSKQLKAHGDIYVDNECRALYFNATSDLRAKENLVELPKNMLDIVNKMQVYTYTYKNNKKKSIGLIAQDLKDLFINDFNFVENLEATGEGEDFMAIKESKIVYILLGAIQELSQKVQDLEKKLREE